MKGINRFVFLAVLVLIAGFGRANAQGYQWDRPPSQFVFSDSTTMAKMGQGQVGQGQVGLVSGSDLEALFNDVKSTGSVNNAFVRFLKKIDAKLGTRLGLMTNVDLATGKSFYGPRTILARPGKMQWLTINHAPFKEYERGGSLKHNTFAAARFDQIIKQYLWQPPKDWFLNRLFLEGWGGYDWSDHVWRGGFAANYPFSK